MNKKEMLEEHDLAALAKDAREAAGKTRSQAARELGVSHVSIIHAEDHPEKSFLKLRKRIIETYSAFEVVGPKFWLEKRESKERA